MPEQIQKKNWPMRVAAVLICLVMVTTHMLSGLYAKFSTEDFAVDEGRVAAFVFRANNADKIVDLSAAIRKPGDKLVDIAFTVTNKSGLAISEVSQSYTIQFRELGSLPLIYTVCGPDGEVIARYDALEDSAVNTAEAFPSEPASGSFSAAVESSKTYKLTVEWPAEEAYKDPKYAGGVAALGLQIQSRQTD